jgi:hypothetical protein
MVYTITPSSAGNSARNSSFCFEEGEYKEVVSGGATYSHLLWDYAPDHVSVFGWQGWMYVHKLFKIEKRAVTENRSIVLLHLSAKTCCCAALRAKNLPSPTLQRFDPYDPDSGFNRFQVMTKEGLHVTVARNKSFASATIPATSFGVIQARANMAGKSGLTCATIRSQLKDRSSEEAAILADYFKNSRAADGPLVVHNPGVLGYQFVKNLTEYDPSAKETIVSFMTPFLGPSPAPQACYNNDVACIDGRINKIKHMKEKRATSFVVKVIQEFVELLIPDEHRRTLVPVDVETVFARQPRPTQQNILFRADLEGDYPPEDIVQAFQKREQYGKITHPRNISTVPGSMKRDYSRYVYALSDWAKGKESWGWYAFGRTPVEIATKVAAIAANAQHLLVTDYSRMDGRKSNLSRMVWRALMLRAFDVSHHDELDALLTRQVNLTGYTQYGVKFETGWSQMSGSPDTSLSNSVDTAFGAYLGYRFSGHSEAEATAWLPRNVLIGGDDAIMADIVSECVEKAAKTVGHVLKTELYPRDAPGLNFLARVYSPAVWYGDPSSMCHFSRQMMKFHSTPARGVDYTLIENQRKKLLEKALSFFLTDAHTPVIGEFCKLALILAREEKESYMDGLKDRMKKGERWWSRYDREDQFPQVGDTSWMVDQIRRELPDFSMPKYEAWIVKVKRLDELLTPPLLLTEALHFEVPPLCAVDGDFALNTPVSEESKDSGIPEAPQEKQITAKPRKPVSTPSATPAAKRTSSPSSRGVGTGKRVGRKKGKATKRSAKWKAKDPAANPPAGASGPRSS